MQIVVKISDKFLIHFFFLRGPLFWFLLLFVAEITQKFGEQSEMYKELVGRAEKIIINFTKSFLFSIECLFFYLSRLIYFRC